MGAREIARQIILRNIGGLIVVDFIDMEKKESNRKVKECMDQELSKSKMFLRTTELSEFGLMEITRKMTAGYRSLGYDIGNTETPIIPIIVRGYEDP